MLVTFRTSKAPLSVDLIMNTTMIIAAMRMPDNLITFAVSLGHNEHVKEPVIEYPGWQLAHKMP